MNEPAVFIHFPAEDREPIVLQHDSYVPAEGTHIRLGDKHYTVVEPLSLHVTEPGYITVIDVFVVETTRRLIPTWPPKRVHNQ